MIYAEDVTSKGTFFSRLKETTVAGTYDPAISMGVKENQVYIDFLT